MQTPPDPKDPRKSNPARPPVPEMVGATGAPFYLGSTPTEISLAIHAPTGPALLRPDLTQRSVAVTIENVTCELRAPNYEVYLNVPHGDVPDKHPELLAGSLGMFGIVSATYADERHGANGLSFKLNVTDLFFRLVAMKNWDDKNLRIYFVPGDWDVPIPKVRVGRVALYFA